MTSKQLEVTGFGNAIVDVLARCDDQFLADHDIQKGGMTLIEEDRAKSIYGAMAPSVEISGGSVANTIASIASFGGQGGFVGKVAEDALGEIFTHDIRAMGVEYQTAPLKDGPATARCLVNVTPDAQRSMSTYLGAAGYITEDDVDADQVARSEIVFFEGYLYELPGPRKAAVKASEIAHQHGRRTAITLSDAGCVERAFDSFTDFVTNHIDILLCNEAEAAALFQTSNIEDMIAKAKTMASITAITRSEKGAILVPQNGEAISVAAHKAAKIEDTTGAGDAYAAGFLLGVSRDYDLARSGNLGALAAAEVISHFGARPAETLEVMAKDVGLM